MAPGELLGRVAVREKLLVGLSRRRVAPANFVGLFAPLAGFRRAALENLGLIWAFYSVSRGEIFWGIYVRHKAGTRVVRVVEYSSTQGWRALLNSL